MTAESIFLKACRGERSERVPVWFMRQAGRYLPEYRAVREKHPMLDVIRTPELASEVTMQPIRRFGFDAAIIFADILNPLIGMGIELDFVESIGPVIGNPIRNVDDIERLLVPSPEENVGYTLEAIRQTKEALKSFNVPLIGFSGAPLTLSAYLVEGGKVGSLERVKNLYHNESDAWHKLQEKLTTLVSEYLVAQALAGAEALQIFDSWLGMLSPIDYQECVEPYLLRIIKNVRQAVSVPIIFFATGVSGLLPSISRLPVDVFGVDWRVSLQVARTLLGGDPILQGNLDPAMLYADNRKLVSHVDRILDEGAGLRAHIFNLGHGITPKTPIDAVSTVISRIRGL